jgi:hypothetical protein
MANTIGTTPIAQSISSQLQLRQAQRNADQARKTAETLKAKADQAQTVAERAQENARSLRVEAHQAEGDSIRADQGLQANRSQNQMTARRQTVAAQTQVAEPRIPAPQPSVNAQGQVTGQLVDITA